MNIAFTYIIDTFIGYISNALQIRREVEYHSTIQIIKKL